MCCAAQVGDHYQPVASTLFGGLTHSKTASLNAPLGLPPLTTDSSFLLPLDKAGEKVDTFLCKWVGSMDWVLFAVQGCYGDEPALNVSYTSEHDSGVDLLGGEQSVWSEMDLQRQPAPPTWDGEQYVCLSVCVCACLSVHVRVCLCVCACKCRCWSFLPSPSSERRYLTEAGPKAFDHAHQLYIEKLYCFASLPCPASVQAELVGDTLYALQGTASSSYEHREVCPYGRG